MSAPKKIIQTMALVTAVSLTLSGCATANKAHPDFKKRHKDISSAALVAPEIKVYLLTLGGEKKMMSELVPVMDSITRARLESCLKAKGYVVKKLDLSEATLNAKPELKTALFKVNNIFNKELENMAKGTKKTFEYTLGPDVNVLADAAGSDVLVFVREDAFKKDAAEAAAAIARDTLETSSSQITGVGEIAHTALCGVAVQLAVVDSNDGAILWHNSNEVGCEYDPANKKHLEALIKCVVEPFPDSAKKSAANE